MPKPKRPLVSVIKASASVKAVTIEFYRKIYFMVYTYIEITAKTKFICMVKAVSYVQKWQISVICITCDCDEALGQNGNMHAVLQSPLTLG